MFFLVLPYYSMTHTHTNLFALIPLVPFFLIISPLAVNSGNDSLCNTIRLRVPLSIYLFGTENVTRTPIIIPPPPPLYYTLFLPLHILPTSCTICECIPHFILPYPFSLQWDNWTALIWASQNGHTEAVKALLTAPDINVNYANVSLFLLTPRMK